MTRLSVICPTRKTPQRGLTPPRGSFHTVPFSRQHLLVSAMWSEYDERRGTLLWTCMYVLDTSDLLWRGERVNIEDAHGKEQTKWGESISTFEPLLYYLLCYPIMTPDSMDLVSLVAALNESAIELMKVGAYEGANTLLVDALLILETTKSVTTTLSTSGIDGVDPLTQMDPLHFACSPICPTSPQSAGGHNITPCIGATATALSSALSIYRRQDRLEAPSADSTASRRISSTSFTRAGTRTQQLPSSLQSLTVRLPEPENSKQQQTAIYSRAFQIPTKDEQQQDEGGISPRIATAVLAFNAALCAHLQSVATGDSTIAPHRALCLYSTAYSIVLMEQQKQQTLDWLLLTAGTSHSSLLWQHHGSSSFCEQTMTSRLVVLLQAALCHNMAAIHGDCFWDFAQARWLRCQLAAAIHWTAFSQMETDDFVFFHLGIFFALIDDFRIAPAA